MKRWLIVAGPVLLVAVLVWLGWSGLSTARAARLTLSDLDRLESVLQNPDLTALPSVRKDLAALELHVSQVRAAARPFLWLAPALGWLPKVGPTVASAPMLLDLAVELSGAGSDALDAVGPAIAALEGPSNSGRLAAVVQELGTAAPGLEAVGQRLEASQVSLGSVKEGLHPELARQIERLNRYLPLAVDGAQFAQVVPQLLGFDRPRTYLILLQNDHERRATGGFISGVGRITVENGEITDLVLGDSYAVDNWDQPHPPAPEALRQQMGADLLVLRDSNWSPDFPTSAQVASALYLQDQGIEVDGVIALDLAGVRLLVEALAPLEAPGLEGPITGETVIEQLKQAWEAPATSGGTVQEFGTSDWWAKRKDFMGELAGAAIVRLQDVGDLDLMALARAVRTALEARYLQIWMVDPVPAGLLATRGWDGGLEPPESSDFLALVDSNVGFNKANEAIRQEIDYRVEAVGPALESSLIVTYTHTAEPSPAEPVCDRTPRYGQSYDDLVRRCYWSYTRVYVPDGSTLLESSGFNNVVTEPAENGTVFFAGDFVMRPGEQHAIALRYRLPPLPVSPYRLMVRKQGGAPAFPLRVSAESCYWETMLDRDRTFDCPNFGAP